MAAPSTTVWGATVGNYCRLGIYTNISSTNTETTATIEVWFWSKYSCTDTNNTLYYDNRASSGSATTSQGAVSIGTTHDSGEGWSTTNQVKLKTSTTKHSRTTYEKTRYLYAKLANIDKVNNVAIYASTTYKIPALATYTVTYDKNGGETAPASQTKYYGQDLTLSSTKPTRSGYAFKGWSTAKDNTAEYQAGAKYTANANVTLYAVWQANTWTVSYNANGGTGAPSSQTKQLDSNLTLSSTKPTRTNYTFKGWATSPSASTATYEAGGTYEYNASITLYAVWELSLYPPKITNLKVYRFYDNWEVPDDNGNSMCLTFDYEQSPDGSSIGIDPINIRINPVDDWGEFDYWYYNGVDFDIINQNDKKGSISLMMWTEGFLPDVTYQLTIDIYDGVYYDDNFEIYTTISTVLEGTKFAFDAKSGATGAAVGKNAELDDVFDIGYEARFFKGIRHMILEPNTDLNNVKTPNTYIGANLSTYNYGNCPCESGTFTLIVEGCGEEGQIRQTYINCSKYKPQRFVRFFYQGTWGSWFHGTSEEVVLFECGKTEGYDTYQDCDGDIPLLYSANNYKYLEIYYCDNNGMDNGYIKISDPGVSIDPGYGRIAALQLQEAGSENSIYFRQTRCEIWEDWIYPFWDEASYVKINANGTVQTSIGTNYIRILKVVGIA